MYNLSRDLIGYGPTPPQFTWPRGARLALNLVINYEEGAENCTLNGDKVPETHLSDMANLRAKPGTRMLNIESVYEYGSRRGFWRILNVMEERNLAFTVNAVGLALQQNPLAAHAIKSANADVQAHGWRWIDYSTVSEEVERAHISKCVEVIEGLTGARPLGWYTGRPSINTRRLVVEEGGFLYDSDAYNDDIPYWTGGHGRPHLILPFCLDTSDGRFSHGQGFDLADEFFIYLKDTFDCLYEESAREAKMMTIGLHGRLVGRPGRIAGLKRFLDHVLKQKDVWICQRNDIARYWRDHQKPDVFLV